MRNVDKKRIYWLRDDEIIDNLNMMSGRISRFVKFPDVLDSIKDNYYRHIAELQKRGMNHTASFYQELWNEKVKYQ